MSEQIYAGTAQYNMIYIFAIHDADHEGFLKIGVHSFDSSSSYKMLTPNCEELNKQAHVRIRQYTRTALTRYELLYTELARRTIELADGTKEPASFSDGAVHEVLYRSGYLAKKFYDTDRDSEWFKITLAPAIAAIKAVKEGRNVLTPAEKGEEVIPGFPDALPKIPIIRLRDEQKECIKKTKKVFATSDRMLWDCKMRFGKTVTAYSLVKEMDYQKVLVVTHRPVVVDGWREDFYKVFDDDKTRVFVTKANIKAGDRFTSEDASIDAENDRYLKNLVKENRPFVYFASMQDLRGSKLVGGGFDKNHGVFAMDWDLIIYDEAHEGTQTDLGLSVQRLLEETKAGKTPKKVLQLSGTPYNLLSQYDDENVYSWDYVMEQQRKAEWDEKHPGDFNPYADLPQLRICTFDLRNKMATSYRFEDESIAFNFREFFRTWTGDNQKDHQLLPKGAHVGDFVYESDVRDFLDLISTESEESNYPFSKQEYRDMFRHTFWILPGVKEARAFSAMLQAHPVFGSYKVVNVAGEGDVEMPYDDALKAVRKAIKENPYTITLSCGKLTTGVTVKEWTGVMLLSGSSSTAAAGYMQTVFRVQSAGSIDGKQKKVCYAFDFAPDRALKVLSEVHQLKKHAVGTDDAGRIQLGKFLNFCPVLAEGDTGMEFYDVPKMMKQLKRLTVDAAVKSGFDDDSIYKADAGIVMDLEQARLMEFLRMRLSPQKKGQKPNKVTVNDQGLTDEQYQKAQDAKRKPKKERTPEEKAALEKEREMKKKQQDLFNLLRNVSIRLPLLIYGTATDFDESIRLAQFIDIVDEASWQEFMPKEVDKDLFRRLLVFYDEDVIEGAGLRIRRLAKAADELMPTQRILRIAEIFSYFRNPAKETVLTPWRVVNMHLGDTVGGYNFYKEGYPDDRDGLLDEPRLIDNGAVTDTLVLNEDVQVLEMNSKSGLYPLYVAYSIYRMLLPKAEEKMTLEEAQKVWDEVLRKHLYVLCQTAMAVSITKRTLVGYRRVQVNAIYIPKLLDRMQNDPKRLTNKITNPATWGKEGDRLKFNAIVGNPPYQKEANRERAAGSAAQMAMPVFNYFVDQAIQINPEYCSMIIPARWYSGGIGLNDFREKMLTDKRLVKLVDYVNSRDCFNTVDIAGGLCYFLWDAHTKEKQQCEVINVSGNNRHSMTRPLDTEGDIFIRSNLSLSILEKIKEKTNETLQSQVLPRNPFDFGSNARGEAYPFNDSVKLIHSKGEGFVARSAVKKNSELIDKFKVYISPLVPCNGEVGIDPSKGYKSITTPRMLAPGEICTDSYIIIGTYDTYDDAIEFSEFMTCKLPRYLLRLTYSSMHVGWQNFRYVPKLNLHEKWTDTKLYSYFGFSEEEIGVVESTMRAITLNTADDE